MGWYEDMEKAEQERDAREYECAMAFNEGYDRGRADGVDEFAGNIIDEIEEIKEWYEEKHKEINDVQICIILDDLNELINWLKDA